MCNLSFISKSHIKISPAQTHTRAHKRNFVKFYDVHFVLPFMHPVRQRFLLRLPRTMLYDYDCDVGGGDYGPRSGKEQLKKGLVSRASEILGEEAGRGEDEGALRHHDAGVFF